MAAHPEVLFDGLRNNKTAVVTSTLKATRHPAWPVPLCQPPKGPNTFASNKIPRQTYRSQDR